jgi:hypothetical protein
MEFKDISPTFPGKLFYLRVSKNSIFFSMQDFEAIKKDRIK